MKRPGISLLLIIGGIVLLWPHHQPAPRSATGVTTTEVVILSDDQHGFPPPTTAPTISVPPNMSLPATTAQPLAQSNTDALERTTPLVQHLPRSTPHYSIDYAVAPDGHLRLTVTLLAVLNSPSQVEDFRTDLRAYKGGALDWLRSQGADATTLDIRWLPPEAGAL